MQLDPKRLEEVTIHNARIAHSVTPPRYGETLTALLRFNRSGHMLLRFRGQRSEVVPHRCSYGFVLDLLTGTFFMHWYTGNWNHFDNIDYRAE